MDFDYVVQLKEGYRSTMQQETKTEVHVTIKASNRITATRAIKALFKVQ